MFQQTHSLPFTPVPPQIIDYESVRNLELLANARTGGVKGSLLGGIDKTKTSVGASLLRAQVRIWEAAALREVGGRQEQASISDPPLN